MPPRTRSWAEMLAAIEQRLVARTGDDVATWADRVRVEGPDTEPELRAWLAERAHARRPGAPAARP